MKTPTIEPRLTVITPTVRPGGIDIMWKGLKNQTFTDFRWLIVDEIRRQAEILDYTKDDRVMWLLSPPKKPGMFWNLDQSNNYAIKHTKSELVVILQDYIYLLPNALEKMIANYDRLKQFSGDLSITGVGHKYRIPSIKVISKTHPITCYDRDISRLNFSDFEIFDKDPRMQNRGLHVCNPIEWEESFCLFSRNLAYELGGFDEDFDAGWGYDNVNFAERISALGYFLWLDETNEYFCISHEDIFKELDIKECAPNNEDLWKKKLDSIRDRKEVRLDYLKQLS